MMDEAKRLRENYLGLGMGGLIFSLCSLLGIWSDWRYFLIFGVLAVLAFFGSYCFYRKWRKLMRQIANEDRRLREKEVNCGNIT